MDPETLSNELPNLFELIKSKKLDEKSLSANNATYKDILDYIRKDKKKCT